MIKINVNLRQGIGKANVGDPVEALQGGGGDHRTPISLPFYVLVVIFLYEIEEHNSSLYYL